MILYDLIATQPHGNFKHHGGGTYAKFVFHRMIERGIDFACFYDSLKYIDEEIVEKIRINNITLIDINKYPINDFRKVINNPLIFSILPKTDYCIYPTIGTIHDCRGIDLINDIYEFLYPIKLKIIIKKILKSIYPKYFIKRELYALESLIDNQNFFFNTITNYTKELLCKHIEICRKKEIPIFQTPFFIDNVNVPILKNNEILLVSGDRPLKNNLRVIKALDELFSEGKLGEFKINITGTNSGKIYKYRIKNIERFNFLGYVTYEQLKELYKKAYIFIFPSLNEGFGIPPLEAMNYFTPVIASNYSAIPEVCQNNVVYINPLIIDDIKIKILKLIEDKKLYRDLQVKGKTHASNMYKKSLLDIDRYINYVIKVNNEKSNKIV